MSSKGDSVWLVFSQTYALLGVASSDDRAYKLYKDEPIRVVGPFPVNEEVDWDWIEETNFGKDPGVKLQHYINMKDGVPFKDMPDGLTYLARPTDKERHRLAYEKVKAEREAAKAQQN